MSCAPAPVPPPFRIVTDRLVIRCYDVGDAPLVKEALDESRDHLLPWLPFAVSDPEPVEKKVELLRGFRESFLAGRDFVYGVLDRDEARVLGGTGLHPRVGPRAFELGYWVRRTEIGRGLATELAAALTRVAFEICGVDRVEIRVAPGNAASLAIPRKLEFEREARLKRRIADADGTLRDVFVFSLFASEYPGSPASRTMLRAWDAFGREIVRRR